MQLVCRQVAGGEEAGEERVERGGPGGGEWRRTLPAFPHARLRTPAHAIINSACHACHARPCGFNVFFLSFLSFFN